MPATTTRTRWFGNLLDWQYDRQQAEHCAWYHGHTYHLTKIDRATANNNRTSPGWCLWYPEPLDGWHGFGPPLGSSRDHARRAAEVWIICPYSDMLVSEDGPGLSAAIREGGACAWGNLVINPDHEHGQFTLGPERGDPVAVIRPVFLGAGSAVTVRWRAFTPTGELLASGGTWRDMLRDLQPALAAGAAQPALPGFTP